MEGAISILLLSDEMVGIALGDSTCIVTPTVAIEIAQSLLLVAEQADITLDPACIMQVYRDSHGLKREVH